MHSSRASSVVEKEGGLFFAILLLQAVAVVVLPFVFARARPSWSRARITLLSAAPVPAVLLVLCMWVFADAALTAPEKCGTDACSMGMMAALMGVAAALCLLLVGILVSAVVVRFTAASGEKESYTDVFS